MGAFKLAIKILGSYRRFQGREGHFSFHTRMAAACRLSGGMDVASLPPPPPSVLHAQVGRLYLAVYDIGCPDQRRRVARVLEGWGLRVPRSAFALRLNKAGRERLVRQLEAVAPDTGSVCLYRVDETRRRDTVGEPGELPCQRIDTKAHCFIA